MNDLISRQAAIDAAMKDVSDKRTHDFNAGATRAANRIKLLPSAQPVQRWIPCSERLPKDHKPKLLTHEVHYITGKVIKDVRMAYYDDENDDWLSDEESPEILCYPLAWMPLPEPYKGGEQNVHSK